jgi:hypothetical protein
MLCSVLCPGSAAQKTARKDLSVSCRPAATNITYEGEGEGLGEGDGLCRISSSAVTSASQQKLVKCVRTSSKSSYSHMSDN